MTEWPEAFAIRAAIAWNEDERKRALAESKDGNVPKGLSKIVEGKKVPVTVDEYRASRAKDAERFKGNIKQLKETAMKQIDAPRRIKGGANGEKETQ